MDPKLLILLLVCFLLVPVSAKDGDPCTSASDCDSGEWCEAARCKYYSCSTDSDCPPCGICAKGICYRSGNEDCDKPIIGEVIPLDPDTLVDPTDLIATGGGQEVVPIQPTTQQQPQDMTWLYLTIIVLLVVVIGIFALKKNK